MVDSALKQRFMKNKQIGGGGVLKTVNLAKRIYEKRYFLIAIFANLFVQLGITYFVMENYNKLTGTTPPPKSNDKTHPKTAFSTPATFFIYLLLIAIVVVLAIVSMPAWLKFVIFCVFSSIWGYLLSILNLDPNLVHMAIFGAMSIFATMMVVGGALIASGIQLGFQFGFFLFLALLFLILFRVVMMFMGTYSFHVKALSMIGLIIFSLYIMYDTNRILQREYFGDFITASLDYYLDILNIFLDLINLGQN
jgi:FtsH-binding integral membrane protein